MTDPVTDRIDAALRAADATTQRVRQEWDASSFGRVHREASLWVRFWMGVAVAAAWVWSRAVRPALRPVWRAVRWACRRYVALWMRSTYTDGQFSRVRGGLMLAATIYLIWITPRLAELVWDGGLYAATARVHEQVYITSSQEITPEHNVHAVRGCEHLPCSDQDSIYFRVRPTLFNHAWSLVHHRSVFFPDFVAAAAPNSTSRCTITSYGVRIKLIMRGFDIYPDLLEMSCG